MLLAMLPPIVHIHKEADKEVLRWCLERMRQELSNPQPGGFLVAQQLATTLLVQALRLHLAGGNERRRRLAVRACRQADVGGHQRHARRARASLDAAGARPACGHVANDLRAQVQGHGGRFADGLSHALANVAGGGQAGEFQRSRFPHRPIAGLRFRKRVQHGVQARHGMLAPAVWPPSAGACAAGRNRGRRRWLKGNDRNWRFARRRLDSWSRTPCFARRQIDDGYRRFMRRFFTVFGL